MNREERRQALIEATLPLLRERGMAVTTAEIAQAAGIAEGTIFRVFDSKDELIDAAIDHVLDPRPVIVALGAIDAGLPLDQRVIEIVRLWHDRVAEVSVVMMALHTVGEQPHRPRSFGDRELHEQRNAEIIDAVAGVLAPDADRLAYPVQDVAHLLRSFAFASSHPLICDRRVTDPRTIAHVCLHGVLREPEC